MEANCDWNEDNSTAEYTESAISRMTATARKVLAFLVPPDYGWLNFGLGEG